MRWRSIGWVALFVVGCGGDDSPGEPGGSSGTSGQSGSAGAAAGKAGAAGASGGSGGQAAGGTEVGGQGGETGGTSAGGQAAGGTEAGGAGGGGGEPGGQPEGGMSGGSGQGGAGQGGVAGAGGQGGALPPSDHRRARVATLTELSVWQAVKIPLTKDGSPVAKPNAPVVAGRSALVRAYVKPAAGFTPRVLRATLRLDDGAGGVTELVDEHQVTGPSTDGALGSGFTFELAAAQVTPQARVSVELTDATAEPDPAGEVTGAVLPAGGEAVPLGARLAGAPLHLTLVPMRYDTDGSGRLPDTSPAQLDRYEQLLRALYPISDIKLTVRDPVPWSKSLTFNGNVNFGTLNSLLVDLKADDDAPSEEYYYALISPDKSLSAYCGSSCVTGQSFVVDDADDGDIRVGSGMGFGTESSAWTLVHELGHIHGRSHAPCSTSSYDDDYPYDDGGTGVWGYDRRSQELLDPDDHADVMGYCDPTWISDYTYRAFFDRVQALGQASGPSSLQAWSTLIEDADGSLSPGPTVRRRRGHAGRVPLGHGGAVWFSPAP